MKHVDRDNQFETVHGVVQADMSYRFFVNDERTLLVRLWEDGGQGHVEVATRESPTHTWGPPQYLTEEKIEKPTPRAERWDW